jgi:hypothetical protein
MIEKSCTHLKLKRNYQLPHSIDLKTSKESLQIKSSYQIVMFLQIPINPKNS